MKNKIFRSLFSTSVAVLLLCTTLILGILFEYFGSVQKKQLSAECNLAAIGVETGGMNYFDKFTSTDIRITLIAQDGTVLYDNVADVTVMENHMDRAEVISALEYGTGESERYSDTVFEKTIYYAKRLSDGSIIRTSVTRRSVWAFMLGLIQPMLVIVAILLFISVAASDRLAKNIVKPLGGLNLEKPLENDTYEELSPLLRKIEHLRKSLNKEKSELIKKQEEFYSVTEGMREGLVLLNNDNIIVSINKSALTLFETDKECVGQNILSIFRKSELRELLDTTDEFAETQMSIAGRIFQMSVAPVKTDEGVSGRCILTFDVTEKIQSERMRREFTSNVSHELKTPLHSIMGMAELIETGMAQSDDIPKFSGRIRREASRLVVLIDDIIRLSQLDDEREFTFEDVDLHALVDDVVQTLGTSIYDAEVNFEIEGESTVIHGVRCLLYEIVYNLCDNALKYNVKGGNVRVFTGYDADNAILRVCDTGIGIPAEHQSRVFERFYRVDKSHSRACKGTGLGLSIVKHAAEYHGAEIEIHSKEKSGTEITIFFPLNI